MKVGQKTIVRWIAKRAAKRSEGAAQPPQLRELDAEQQRQVAGGNGSSQLPKLGW
jgi:hypothetical protein